MTILNDLGTVIGFYAGRHPQRVAVQLATGTASGARTYRELDERSTRLAHALHGLGLAPGDRIGAWLEDIIEYVDLYVAAAKAGVVVVPVNAAASTQEADYQLARAAARALVYSPSQAGRVEELAARDELVLLCCSDERARGRSFEDVLAHGSLAPLPAPPPDAAFMICFTSGTTGRPKGAVLTHRSVMTVAMTQMQALRIPLNGVNVRAVSLSFAATVPSHLVPHLVAGGTEVIVSGSWDSDRLIGTIERERGTHIYVPGPALREFTSAAAADPGRWQTLTSVLHAGSRADPALLGGLADVIGSRYLEGWGMTEVSGGVATATTARDYLDQGPGFYSTVGRAVIGSAIRVVNDAGEVLPPGTGNVGELSVRSAAAFAGYWDDPEATARVMHDGWYQTGDIGALDENGLVYMSDRRTNLIVSGGMNIYPAEIEMVLEQMPGVRECAVVAGAHDRWGQTPVAVVVAEPGAALTEQAIAEFCRARLASYKKPTRLLLVDSLPRTTGGKVARGILREQLASQLSPA